MTPAAGAAALAHEGPTSRSEDGWLVLARQLGALCERQLKRTARAPGKFIGIAMNPVVMIIALGILFVGAIKVPDGVNYRSYVVAGVAVQVGLACIGPTAISVAIDRRSGLVVRTRTMPVRSWPGLAAQMAADVAAGVVALVLVLAIGLSLGWRPRADAGDLLLSGVLLVASYAAATSVGALLGLLVSDPEALEPIGALLLVLFSFFSNAFISPDTMPRGVRQVAEWNPVSAIASTCRDLWGLSAPTASTSFAATHPQTIAVVSVLLVLVVATAAATRILSRTAR